MAKRFIYLWVLLCIPFLTLSQNGKVLYNVVVNELAKNAQKNTENIDSAQFLEQIYSSLPEFYLELAFNDKVSRFRPVDKLKDNINDRYTELAKKTSCPGTYYIKRINGDIYKHKKEEGQMIAVYSKQNKIKWTLIDSTKTILGYKCYKAITTYSNKKSKFNEGGFEIEAWYTKEIPVSLGPLDYGSLPGLILELNTVLYKYSAVNIDIDRPVEKLTIPDVDWVISEDEYNAKLKKTLGRN